MQSKFENPLKKRLLHINKNLYIHRTDPLFKQKVLLYLRKLTPEEHFQVGKKWKLSRNEEKTSYYQKDLLEDRDISRYKTSTPRSIKLLILSLFTSNTILLILLYLTLQRI
ncbi:hypothetical protein [Ammoniphilus sp. CFH 90114]|uniref:hypothetical protein n=1 Tax=Ammoniphilus sp. CFH 90114 TaxID=2493665 RepID=UPI00100E7392|nr:hypothetical protein [Ammoniphilus sp. CFH 90114]RXT04386.1 hypothetical protein EIZ39_21155 [Ammoniphilus sp. CFH 90114]